MKPGKHLQEPKRSSLPPIRSFRGEDFSVRLLLDDDDGWDHAADLAAVMVKDRAANAMPEHYLITSRCWRNLPWYSP